MKKWLCISVALIAFAGQSAFAATIESFCPESWNEVGLDGNGILKVWGVPELSGYPLLAVASDTWPKFMAVASWRDALVDAKRYGTCVKIHYDPTLYHEGASGVDGCRIWEMME
jgi:hypothetical protein